MSEPTFHVNKQKLLYALEAPIKASTAVNLSTFSDSSIILFRFLPTGLQLFGHSSSIEALSEIGIESENFEGEDVRLFQCDSLLRFLKSSKEEEISLILEENFMQIVAEGLLDIANYKDHALIFPYEEPEKLLNVDVNLIESNFCPALHRASKYPYTQDIQEELAGIGIYKGYVFGIQREMGIIISLGTEHTVDKVIPTTVTSVFPKADKAFGNFDNTAIVQFTKDGVTITTKFSLLIYDFNKKLGDTLLKYIKMEKGKFIFNKNQIQDTLRRISGIALLQDQFIEIRFIEEEFADFHLTTGTQNYAEPIPVKTEGIEDLYSFQIKVGLLKEMLNFCKESDFTIYAHPLYKSRNFDLPFLVTNDTGDWLYVAIAKGAKHE